MAVAAFGETDPAARPLTFFGTELRRWRTEAGLSLEQFGARVGFSPTLVGKVETGVRPPTADFARHCDAAVPEAHGLFGRLHALARNWDGGHPSWFAEWLDIEARATSLRWWEITLVPGLLQTPAYARALFAGSNPDADADAVDQLVEARLARQAILDREKPPLLWVVLDEAVLRRCIGSPEIMREQLLHLADMAGRPRITIQIVPARVAVHAGLLGAFIIAGLDGGSDTVYLETASTGQTVTTPSVVERIALAWESLRSVALPRDESRDLILRVVEEQWT